MNLNRPKRNMSAAGPMDRTEPPAASNMTRVDIGAVEVIAPNFKQRLSGVTSTIVQLVPLQMRSLGIATLGPGLPDTLPRLKFWQLPGLLRRPAARQFRIWHARRNMEMLAGILLRDVFRAPLRLLFTSAAQRNHKRYTKWLIRQMDAVIATSERSGSFLEVPHTVVMHGIDLEEFHPPRDGRGPFFGVRPARVAMPSVALAASGIRKARISSSMPWSRCCPIFRNGRR